jgi:hypothetical protein
MRYRVLAPMHLHPGALLGLTEEQAAARSFGLAPEGEMWRVVKPVGFKAGEEIEHDGELPKTLAAVVESVPSSAVATAVAAVKRAVKRKG